MCLQSMTSCFYICKYLLIGSALLLVLGSGLVERMQLEAMSDQRINLADGFCEISFASVLVSL